MKAVHLNEITAMYQLFHSGPVYRKKKAQSSIQAKFISVLPPGSPNWSSSASTDICLVTELHQIHFARSVFLQVRHGYCMKLRDYV